AEAVNVEFTSALTEDRARAALRKAPGIIVLDHRADEGYVTPAEAAGEDAVYVSRIRRDPTVAYGLNLWVVADNLRKGAATNAIQIAEALVKRRWLPREESLELFTFGARRMARERLPGSRRALNVDRFTSPPSRTASDTRTVPLR